MTNPKLRFAQNADWRFRRLNEVVEINPSAETLPEEFFYIDLESVKSGRLLSKNLIKRTEAPSRAQRLLKNRDVLFQMVRPYQQNNFFVEKEEDFPWVSSTGYAQLRSSRSDPKFVYYALHQSSFLAEVLNRCTGGTYPAINAYDLGTISIGIPQLSEQRKLADFFSTLDEKIVLAERKLTALQTLKSGLMQKIFSREIRFKREDGSSFLDWIDVTVGDVAETCGGGTPSTGNEDFWGGDIQWLTPTEINSKYVHASKRTITDAGLKNSSAKLLPKEALVLTTRATVGACSINQFEGRVCTNQGFQSLICNAKVIPEFLYYVICSEKFQKAMLTNASGSTFLELSPKNLMKLPIEIPCQQEQRKIVAVLSELDKKIVIAEKHIDLLKLQKQAFMQQMFV